MSARNGDEHRVRGTVAATAGTAAAAFVAGLLAGALLHPPAAPTAVVPSVHFVQTVRDDDGLGIFDEPQDPIDDPTQGRYPDPTSRRLTDFARGVLYATRPSRGRVCIDFVSAGRRSLWCEPVADFQASGLLVRLTGGPSAARSTVVRWRPDGRLEWW